MSTVSFTTTRATRQPQHERSDYGPDRRVLWQWWWSWRIAPGVLWAPNEAQGQRCSKPNTTACLASAPALPHPSGKKPLDVVQHYLVVVGFREDRTVLTKLTRSMGCALRGASKDNVQLRPH